jgi:tetraacyldisaccharide 4'-kinase
MRTALQRAWLRRGGLALALMPLAVVYRIVMCLRAALYRYGWFAAQSLPAPVIVVGNLIAGGAGKTPTVMAVVRLLQDSGYTPGVISRGYGRQHTDAAVTEVQDDTAATLAGDEPLLLRLRLHVPVFVGVDRVAVARSLLATYPQVDIVVSDDGLQHLRLPRAAQLIVFDERGAGNGWLLPAGPLREPMAAQPPAHSVVLYNAASASTSWPGHLAQHGLSGLVELAAWWSGEPATLAQLQALIALRTPVIAAAGVAQPERFFNLLRAAGVAFTPLALADHCDYRTLPWPANAPHVVVTEKDAVKLKPDRVQTLGSTTQIWVAPLDFAGDAAFAAAVLALLANRPAHQPPRSPPVNPRTPDGHPTA